MEVSTEEIVMQAYRLIRRKARDVTAEIDDATLGSYVRGVVDLQTELYEMEWSKKRSQMNNKKEED